MLRYASSQRRDDTDLVQHIILEKPQTYSHPHSDEFQYASDRIRDIKSVVLEVIRHFPPMFEYASPRLRDEEDVVKEALELSPSLLQHVSLRLRDCPEIVLPAIRRDESQVDYASENLKATNEEVQRIQEEWYEYLDEQEKNTYY